MKTLTSRLMTAVACIGLMLSAGAQAGGIDIRIPGVDVRLPAPPLPRVTIVEPEVHVYHAPRHYAPPPPPRHYERRYYDRDYDRRDYRDYRDDRYYHRRYQRHHHYDRHDW